MNTALFCSLASRCAAQDARDWTPHLALLVNHSLLTLVHNILARQTSWQIACLEVYHNLVPFLLIGPKGTIELQSTCWQMLGPKLLQAEPGHRKNATTVPAASWGCREVNVFLKRYECIPAAWTQDCTVTSQRSPPIIALFGFLAIRPAHAAISTLLYLYLAEGKSLHDATDRNSGGLSDRRYVLSEMIKAC